LSESPGRYGEVVVFLGMEISGVRYSSGWIPSLHSIFKESAALNKLVSGVREIWTSPTAAADLDF
jgi:hypothetical protein